MIRKEINYRLEKDYGLVQSTSKNRDPSKKYSGLDDSKFKPGDLFALPARAKGTDPLPTCRAFKRYDELERNKLDVVKFLENSEYLKDMIIQEEQGKKEQEVRELVAIEKLNKIRKSNGSKPLPMSIDDPKTKKAIDTLKVRNQQKNTYRASNNKDSYLYDKLLLKTEEMTPGNRSSLACQIAGAAQYIEDPGLRQELFYAMVNQGIDKAAQKSVINYMRL